MRIKGWARAAVVALAVTVVPVLHGAPAAQAAIVPVPYQCTTTAFGVDYVATPQNLDLDVVVPEAVAQGDPLEIDLNSFGAPDAPPFATSNANLSVSIAVQVRKVGDPVTESPALTAGPQGPFTIPARAPMPATTSGEIDAVTTGFADADDLEVLAGDIVFTWLSGDDDVTGMTMTCSPTTTTVVGTSSVFSADDRCVAKVTCTTSQSLDGEVLLNPDGLRQGQLDNQTDIGAVTTSPVAQTLSGAFDSVWVSDVRGSNLGWTQSAFMASDLISQTTPSLTIPANRLTITPSCAPTTTDIDTNVVAAPLPGSTCTAGSSATFGGTGSGQSVTIASTPNVASGTGGVWKVDMGVSLSVPSYQAASVYKGTLTIVLTSN